MESRCCIYTNKFYIFTIIIIPLPWCYFKMILLIRSITTTHTSIFSVPHRTAIETIGVELRHSGVCVPAYKGITFNNFISSIPIGGWAYLGRRCIHKSWYSCNIVYSIDEWYPVASPIPMRTGRYLQIRQSCREWASKHTESRHYIRRPPICNIISCPSPIRNIIGVWSWILSCPLRICWSICVIYNTFIKLNNTYLMLVVITRPISFWWCCYIITTHWRYWCIFIWMTFYNNTSNN